MFGIDDKYFKDAIDYTQEKLGFGSGQSAVDTLGKLFKKDEPNPVGAAAASAAPVPQLIQPKLFGMTQSQLMIVGAGLIVAFVVLRKTK